MTMASGDQISAAETHESRFVASLSLCYWSLLRNLQNLSLANSHLKQPPEAEIARDSTFPSGSY